MANLLADPNNWTSLSVTTEAGPPPAFWVADSKSYQFPDNGPDDDQIPQLIVLQVQADPETDTVKGWFVQTTDSFISEISWYEPPSLEFANGSIAFSNGEGIPYGFSNTFFPGDGALGYGLGGIGAINDPPEHKGACAIYLFVAGDGTLTCDADTQDNPVALVESWPRPADLPGIVELQADMFVEIVTPPSNGTVNGDESFPPSFTYTPNPRYTGLDSFTYLIKYGTGDGSVSSELGTVSITVEGATPVSFGDPYIIRGTHRAYAGTDNKQTAWVRTEEGKLDLSAVTTLEYVVKKGRQLIYSADATSPELGRVDFTITEEQLKSRLLRAGSYTLFIRADGKTIYTALLEVIG